MYNNHPPSAVLPKWFLFLMVAALCLGIAWAQTPTGAIEGDVTDPTGALVPGAKITVTEVATGRSIPAATNDLGRFSIRNLLPGEYRLKVEASGFATNIVERLLVSSGQVVNGSVRLELGKSGEIVSVEAQAVMVDTARQTVDTIVGTKEINALPLFSRNFLELAGMAPGVLIRDGGDIDPTKVNAYRVVGTTGRSGTATRVQIDGIDVTDETVGTTVANFSQESVNEFQLTRSSLDPSTSLTSSGAINIISKQGGNVIHGSFFTDYYNQDMGARINYDQTEAYPFHRKRVGGSAGGPFVKDKLFWYGSVERSYQTEQQVSRNRLFPSLDVNQEMPVGIRYVDTRMDWNAKSSVRVFGKFHHDWNISTGGSAVSPFQNIDWTNILTVGLDYTKAASTHTYRFGYVNFNNRIESQELNYKFLRTPNGIPYYLTVGSFGAGPNSLAPQATYQDNWQNSYEGSWFKGKHTVRWGFDIRRIILGGFANFAGPTQVTGTYDDATVAALKARGANLQDPNEYPLEYFSMGPANGFFNLAAAHGLPHGGHFVTRPSWFVQDNIKARRNLSLNVGLRWQYDTGYFASRDIRRDFKKNASDPIPFMQRWGNGFADQPIMPKNLFSPSFGFAWDPKGDGKTVIRGGFYKAYEMNILNNTMFDEFDMLPNGLGPDLYEIYGVTTPDGTPINIDGKHSDGDYSDLIGAPIKNVIGLIGQLQAALSSAYSTYQFDPNKGVPAFISSGGLYYGSVIPGSQFRMPYALQWNLGVQREVRRGTVFTADYIYNHAVGLPFIREDFERRRDAATLNVAAARSAVTRVIGSSTMDQWIAANPTRNVSAFSFISDTILPGLYPDMTRARFTVGGFTKYQGVQFNLRGSSRGAAKFRDLWWNVSYAIGKGESSSTVGRVEFIATTDCNNKPNDKACFGPNSLDRTHMLTGAGSFTIPGGFRFNSIWAFRTNRPYDIYIPNLGGPTSGTNSVFANDMNGDNFADRIPQLGAGQWGRGVKDIQGLNKVIEQFNQTYAGQLGAHAKALVAAGLFTEAQLKKLGAVIPAIPLVPTTNPSPWHNLFTTDLRVDRPIKLGKLREGLSVTPYADLNNLFNHSPANPYSGLGLTYGNLNFDYSKGGVGQGPSDLDVTRGRNAPTRRVMIGVRVDF